MGDCLEVLKQLEDNSVDAIVTDPPAGIGFMGKTWDSFGTPVKQGKSFKGINNGWFNGENRGMTITESNKSLVQFQNFIFQVFSEAIRVLKPGGHALVWAIPRTSHHTAMGLERAGFEVRDRISHCFGSGFPKSLNIGKAVDKLQGNEREHIGEINDGRTGHNRGFKKDYVGNDGTGKQQYTQLTKGTSEFEGLGTALKPAIEDWWLVRKPLSEKTIAENCIKLGVGGLSIDECRINYSGQYDIDELNAKQNKGVGNSQLLFKKKSSYIKDFVGQGRFPSHLILDDSEEVNSMFPNTKSGKNRSEFPKMKNQWLKESYYPPEMNYGDNGSASRFFYCAKSSRSERNMGCEGLEEKRGIRTNAPRENETIKTPIRQNNHPTVKPLALMSYLVKLISRPNQIVLDPFAGSGSTLIACKMEGRRFIGIEKEPDYVKIAEARLKVVPEKLL